MRRVDQVLIKRMPLLATGCLVVVLAGLLGGCFSVHGFQRALGSHDFVTARSILIENQAYGATLPAETTPGVRRANAQYLAAVATYTLAQRDAALAQGRPRTALRQLDQGLELAPWSRSLAVAKNELGVTLGRLDLLEQSWQQTQGLPEDAQLEQILAIPHELRRLSTEEPHVGPLVESGELLLLLRCSRALADYTIPTDKVCADLSRLSDVATLPPPPDHLVALAALVATYDATTPAKGQAAWLAGLQTVMDGNRPQGNAWDQLTEAVGVRLAAWARAVVVPTYAERDLTIAQLDELFAAKGSFSTVGLAEVWRRCAYGALHRRAAWLAGMGRESALALVYDAAALQFATPQEQAASVAPKAFASLQAALPLPVSFRVTAMGPGDAMIPAYAGHVLAGMLATRNRPYVRDADESEHVVDGHLIAIELNDVQWIVDDASRLPRVHSQYLAHYETVVNERKDQLKSELDSRKRACDWAESELAAALNSLKWNPSEYTLSRANSARTAYDLAISGYNSTVVIYNATPDMISQPVYLPYDFFEGDVRFGWIIGGTATIDGVRHSLTTRSAIDTAHVRLGTNPNDRDPERRRDLGSTLNVSLDSAIAHLSTVLERICSELGPLLGSLTQSHDERLEKRELAMLGWIFHPWGEAPPTADRVWLSWAPPLDLAARLTSATPAVPATALRHPIWAMPADGTVAATAKLIAPAVCRIVAWQGQQKISTGSGTCIAPDGLVLTCAHVLHGSRHTVETVGDGTVTSYLAQLLYIDQRNDVALLRAVGFAPPVWAAVRLTAPTVAGEPVFAMGFPGLEDGGIADLAVTQGSVAVPHLVYAGQSSVMLDVNISSGSSGGPVFSQRTGEIIGIVEMVVSPGITTSFSRSGYAAFATPGTDLATLLGLHYE